MKRFLTLFLTFAIAGLFGLRGSAQEVVVNAKAAQAAPPAVQVITDAATGTHLGHGADCGTRKVCVPAPDVIKHSKVVFGCKTKEYCLKGPCGSCDGSCGECDRCGPRTKRVLLKKVVTCETPGFKCEVSEEACPAACTPNCGGCARPGCCGKRGDACEVVVPSTPPANPPTGTKTTAAPATQPITEAVGTQARPLPSVSPR